MNGCRRCGHEQASHHEHVGSCTVRLCICPTFVLRDAGKIRPVVQLSKSWDPSWPRKYRLGDVLDAHLQHPIRRRHMKGETA